MQPSVWAPQGLDLEKIGLNKALNNALDQRDEAIAQRDEYLRHIHKLQAALDKVKRDRSQLDMERSAMEDAFIEFGEKHGTSLEELTPLYKEKLKQKSQTLGIPLD